MFITIENTPISIDLTQQALSTGWTVTGSNAIHESCNTGIMYLIGYPLITGQTYVYSYQVNSISGGNVQARLGSATGTAYTTTGFKTETIVAAGTNPVLSFYSNADCNIDLLTFQQQPVVNTVTKQRQTIVYSEKSNKWACFLSFTIDIGVALFTNLFLFKNGKMYKHEHGSGSRNNFFGVQYDSIIKFVANKDSTLIKTFNSIAIQSNQLLITTTDGITTSLGNVSDLEAEDFLKMELNDGINTIDVYDEEGMYAASFLRDKNSVGGLINGAVLKGNYLIVELVTTDSGNQLSLYSVSVNSSLSHIGVR